MKRCPQCEFIYEDDQTRCDMDGITLVFDEPATEAISQTPAASKRSSSRRSLLAICAVILGVLVFAIGYASLERAFSASSEPKVVTNGPGTQATARETEPAPSQKAVVQAVGEDPAISVVSNTASTSRLAARNPGTEPLQSNSLGTRAVVMGSIPPQNRIDSSRPQSVTVKANPAAVSPKKDSKVVSFAKKTGRFLSKPFK